MAQSAVESQISSSLKIKGKGWNIQLFDDQMKLQECICSHCKAVCVDAVELGCDHKDEEIYPFCEQCLQQSIHQNNDTCIINGHQNPIILPSRSIRRQILKSIVFCPYSSTYQNSNKQQNDDNNAVIDTMLADDEKEGFNPKPAQKPDQQMDDDADCLWKGTLNELLNDHILKCTHKHDQSFDIIHELQNENKQLRNLNDHYKSQLNHVSLQNEVLNEQIAAKNQIINKLQIENEEQQKLIKDLLSKLASQNGHGQRNPSLIDEKKAQYQNVQRAHISGRPVGMFDDRVYGPPKSFYIHKTHIGNYLKVAGDKSTIQYVGGMFAEDRFCALGIGISQGIHTFKIEFKLKGSTDNYMFGFVSADKPASQRWSGRFNINSPALYTPTSKIKSHNKMSLSKITGKAIRFNRKSEFDTGYFNQSSLLYNIMIQLDLDEKCGYIWDGNNTLNGDAYIKVEFCEECTVCVGFGGSDSKEMRISYNYSC